MAVSQSRSGDTPAANPPLAYARIINAHHVKTFDSTGINAAKFAWPAAAPDPGGRGGLTEGDIDEQP